MTELILLWCLLTFIGACLIDWHLVKILEELKKRR